MSDSALNAAVQHQLIRSFNESEQREQPYQHWRLSNLFPLETAKAVGQLPFTPPVIDDTGGRRETHNETRRFFDQDAISQFPTCAAIAHALQSDEVISVIQARCAVDLTHTNLRIEYALDTQGFWLEPHTDLGVKKFTMLAYLAEDAGHDDWGTDIYAHKTAPAERIPATFNTAMIFVPSSNTWHGFEPRKINGIRRTLIINYVTQEWRNRHELAFPDAPISAK